ncbi:unnamed protein product [Rotaria magnacalcarata]|uniref:BZIP domain-containing protein n=5 Tax=Rotaria magnacalcarata TaxID=392030 RepID=A0A815KIZ8_9BILA|nr:unnamed protein product [Rotaria magnacalcarata]CAF1396896.1 unnamed protein product [Rotaria magnacalcarata]CAF2018989.1 unnamed protein product [Rotaria magnacalcarata]CAF2215921.1 unnamed protein product [Rotaria magnacalcarata]CAF3992753.1 unnamed protein product [Rotaria magnacalcarata]
MNTYEFDYNTFLDGLESIDTLSSNTTSTENESDSGIASTPSMSMGLDSTVIDLDSLDIFPLNMESPLSNDPNDEFNHFSALFNGKNPLMPGDNSTFENLFSDIDFSVQQDQEALQQISSPPSEIPSITNCIKVQTYTNTQYNEVQSIKLEPINANSNIRIIKTSKPTTLTNVPVIKMPLVTEKPNSITIVPSKRRRSDSPTHYQQTIGKSTLTLDQLKLQYKNMSEESLKKHLRMIKNRESASLSRQRRKELMENLDVRVNRLTDENEQLKRENSKLLTRIQTLEMENELLRKYKVGGKPTIQPRKPLIVMGIFLLVAFNIFTLKSLAPNANNPSGLMALYNNEGAIIPGRTILSDRRTNNENSYLTNSEDDYRSDKNDNNNPSSIPSYPYIQCVAYINKTHSQRINRDLHSLVQDHNEKESVILPDSKSLSLSSNSIVPTEPDSTIGSLQHVSRKVARQTKSEIKGQIQPYETHEADFNDFIHTIDRKNDTLYFVSFKRDHLILPSTVQNQTQRPKMSLIIPASITNLNKTIRIPANHFPMIKIDCEVEDTKLVFIKRNHIPLSFQNHLFQYYSSASQTSM